MRSMFHRKSYNPVLKKENTKIFYLDECVHLHTHTHTHTHTLMADSCYTAEATTTL